MVGAVEDVWGELGCQIVPVHDAGGNLRDAATFDSSSRVQLLVEAIAMIIYYNRVQMCELRVLYLEEK
jgi:hypothetical protein